MESPDESRRDVEAVLGADDDAPKLDRPECPDLALDELLFGALSNATPAAEAPREPVEHAPLFDPPDQARFLDEDRFVVEDAFAEPEEFLDEEEPVDEEEGFVEEAEPRDADDDTIVAEPADVEDAVEPAEPERGRRRAWVLTGLVTLIVVTGAVAGSVVVGGSADSAPRKKNASVPPVPGVTTSLPVPTTVLPSTAPPASTAPLTVATTRRTVPFPGGAPVQPAPAPAPPPPPATSPPPTSPPPTSPPTTTTSTTSPP